MVASNEKYQLEYMKEYNMNKDIKDMYNFGINLSPNYKNKKILITGATGLIGSLLCRTFINANETHNYKIQIYALVRNEEKLNCLFPDCRKRDDITVICGNITDKLDIPYEIDYIFHCASVTASKYMISNPVETIMTSVEGTHNMLEVAKEKNIKAFVYVSSMEMYGTFTDLGHDVRESDLGYINPLAVRSNYPESKRLCENMCIAYLKEYGVPVKIARLAQTFGVGVLPGENRVFAQFARSVIKKEDIVLHTKGLSEGNYCYTSDAINGLLTIAACGEVGEAYNVSNPEAHMTIAEMAQMVCDEVAKGEIKVVFDIPETNEFGYAADTKMKLDSSKLQALGWKPEVGLKEAYIRLIEYLKQIESY